MINLYKLIPPENKDIFDRHPQLNNIWPMGTMQEMASKSYKEWNNEDKTGEIFLIRRDEYPVGITGWWIDDTVQDILRLRWHGIIPQERGRGYSESAIKLLLERLSIVAPTQYTWLSESASFSRPDFGQVVRHFEKIGFSKFDDPTYEENGHGKTQSLRIRIPRR